jgi:hypothetical protein
LASFLMVLISLETMPSLAPVLHWLFWPNCIFQVFLLFAPDSHFLFIFLFFLAVLGVELRASCLLVRCSNNHATTWMLGCLEVSSTRLTSSSPLVLPRSLRTWTKCKQVLYKNVTQMDSSSMPRVLVPIWNLRSTVFTVPIPVSMQVFSYQNHPLSWVYSLLRLL